MIFQIFRKLFRPLDASQLKIVRAAIFVLLLNFLFGIAFYYVEKGVQKDLTLWDSIWWSIVTMTTVGYGDYYAQTSIGRFVVSYACFFLGIGSIGYILGTIAEVFFNRLSLRRNGLMTIKHSNHIIICNCPSIQKTRQLAHEIRANPQYANAAIVVIADSAEEYSEDFKTSNIDYVNGSPLDEDTLIKANVKASEGVIILATDPADTRSDAQSFATGTLVEIIEKECGRAIKTIVELVSDKNEKMLLRSDIDGVVPTGAMTDKLLVQEFINPGIRKVYEQLVTNVEGSQFYIVETKWIGKSFVDLQIEVLKNQIEAQIVGIIRGQTPTLNPDKNTKIEKNDRLILLAKKPDDFSRIETQLFQKI